ncbi:HAD family hydrolase [Taibaiella sp. KBW10]|uniref:HAD family hydrolase n=1 Tax=Taibaiella sp. KBW10 TaxID=2153357 RepID=UPI000F5ABA41|nr:HAD family hydrolase [Taibaiella sp. KBW10]RQO32364.1 HAD family hydrolase [Taibaiella sp. KBW10]
MKNNISVIAFDADDTLWVNEPYFQETEQKFCALLEAYVPRHIAAQELFKTEMANLHLYGYGVKGFMLCMIETIDRVSKGKASIALIEASIALGKELLQKPIVLLDQVAETLQSLQGKYKLVMATKGDLLDQERKSKQSGLQSYFHHIEIMSDKKEGDYQKLMNHLDCRPDQFLMIGNSLKSDVLPVLALDAYAAHIPYHTTWAHEHTEQVPEHPRLMTLNAIQDILNYIS